MYLFWVLIVSLDCLYNLWLARVNTLVLVLRHFNSWKLLYLNKLLYEFRFCNTGQNRDTCLTLKQTKKNAELEDPLVFQQVLRTKIKGNVKQSVKENEYFWACKWQGVFCMCFLLTHAFVCYIKLIVHLTRQQNKSRRKKVRYSLSLLVGR